MAGHSKWANIRHRKGRADAKKGKAFSQVAKEIISAVKVGGSDIKGNPRLRLAVQKARQVNMPTDNVERNIKKAEGGDQEHYDEITYELYGHGGVGIIVEVMTDNKNRSATDIRIATNKRGGTIAEPGSVAFNFDRKGIIQILKDQAVEDELFMAATDAGAEDFDAEDEECFTIVTDPTQLFAVHDKLVEAQFPIESAGLEMIPKLNIECDEETTTSNQALIDWIDDLDDVTNIFHKMTSA